MGKTFMQEVVMRMRLLGQHLGKAQLWGIVAALGLALTSPAHGPVAWAASHREAPLIALDPTADITDFYGFRSWVHMDRVVFIMNVIPGQEPSSGPNYFNFDDDVLYAINIDTNADGKADDVIYEIRFTTEIRAPLGDFPVAYAGNVMGVLPPITALDGPGSEGIGVRQHYTVTEVRGGHRFDLGTGTMFAVPSNVGPQTMPDYEALAAQGIYQLNNGGYVFAGQRDETFYIDLGATFDTLNFRRFPPILTDAEDARDDTNAFGVDHFSGFNVSSIALEVPIATLTDNPHAIVGAYASTSRFKKAHRKGSFAQVARLANPLVNELIIGTATKDRWNATNPADEAQFLDFYLNPRLVVVLNALFGTNFPTSGRTDLVAALLQYPGQDPASCAHANPCSELLRVNLGVHPTSPTMQKRLGGLAGDAAGFPNGRRPNDDVTDIVVRVAAGALLGPVPNLGDGVSFNIGAQLLFANDGLGNYGQGGVLDVTANGIAQEFPFLPTPFDGRNRRHIDCDEPGGNPCN
jgi:hypothetical protein